MTDRDAKLTGSCLLVVWGSRVLTLGEKVVFHHDWLLDQGGADGSFISHASMEARLGGSLVAGTISKIRQRLKRLTLHEPIRRADAMNLGWISTLPRQFHPRSFREVPVMAVALDDYLRKLTAWSNPSGLDGLDEADSRVQSEQTRESASLATAVGGRGDFSSRSSKRKAQLPSAVSSTTEKRVGAHAPDEKRGDDRPASVIRAEGMALIRLQQGKQLSPEERALVEGWLERNPGKATASDLRRRLSA